MPNGKKKTVVRTTTPSPAPAPAAVPAQAREAYISNLKAELARMEGQPVPAPAGPTRCAGCNREIIEDGGFFVDRHWHVTCWNRKHPAAAPEPAQEPAPATNGTTTNGYRKLPFLSSAQAMDEAVPAGKRIVMKVLGNCRALDQDKFQEKVEWFGDPIPAHLKVFIDVEIDGRQYAYSLKPTDQRLAAIVNALATGKPIEIERNVYNGRAYVDVVRGR